MSHPSPFHEIDRLAELIRKRRAHLRQMRLDPARDHALDVYYIAADQQVAYLRGRGLLPRTL